MTELALGTSATGGSAVARVLQMEENVIRSDDA